MKAVRMRNQTAGQAKRQHGVALAMLLWFVAALTILVAGIVSVSRTDVKMVQLQLQSARATAIGDGATLLAMSDLLLLKEAGEFAGRGIFRGAYTLGELAVEVQARSTAGLVNLNMASVELLSKLFEFGAALDVKEAKILADNIVAWRTPQLMEVNSELAAAYKAEGKTGTRAGRFEVAEDLLQVLGVNRTIYERVADLVVVPAGGQSGARQTVSFLGTAPSVQNNIDPLSAPLELLVMIVGDMESAEEIAAERAEMPYTNSGILGGFVEQGVVSSLLRVDADVTAEDGVIFRRRSWIMLDGVGPNQLPWRIMRSEAVKIVKVVAKETQDDA